MLDVGNKYLYFQYFFLKQSQYSESNEEKLCEIREKGEIQA